MNIDLLQNIVVDRPKIAGLLRDKSLKEIQELFGVKVSQAANLRSGARFVTPDGLLRVLLLHGLRPDEVATIKK